MFALTNQVAASLLGPMIVPLVWGLVIRKTPRWSAWSTAAIGFAVALAMQWMFKPEQFQHWMGWTRPLSGLESDDITLAVTALSIVVICSAWYFASVLFYDPRDKENDERTRSFFQNLQIPIDAKRDRIADYDRLIYKLIGGLCLFYGGFILLLMLIPNRAEGKLCFLFCGGAIFGLGAVLWFKAKSSPAQLQMSEPQTPASVLWDQSGVPCDSWRHVPSF